MIGKILTWGSTGEPSTAATLEDDLRWSSSSATLAAFLNANVTPAPGWRPASAMLEEAAVLVDGKAADGHKVEERGERDRP